MRPRAVDAHRLMGQVQEGLGNKEKAVVAYKTAYELGDGQKDLVLKSECICYLLTYLLTLKHTHTHARAYTSTKKK